MLMMLFNLLASIGFVRPKKNLNETKKEKPSRNGKSWLRQD